MKTSGKTKTVNWSTLLQRSLKLTELLQALASTCPPQALASTRSMQALAIARPPQALLKPASSISFRTCLDNTRI